MTDAETCDWCGAPRDEHDRLLAEWDACQVRDRYFRHEEAS